jgi:hypothetical protein
VAESGFHSWARRARIRSPISRVRRARDRFQDSAPPGVACITRGVLDDFMPARLGPWREVLAAAQPLVLLAFLGRQAGEDIQEEPVTGLVRIPLSVTTG